MPAGPFETPGQALPMDAFTASLAFELEPFGIRSKLVLPGYGPTTAFAANGGDRMQGLVAPNYVALAQAR